MKKKYIMISILLSIVILLTGTYAWLTWKSQSSTAFTFHLGDLADVIITNNNDTLTGNNLGPVLSKEEGLIMEFQVLKKTEDSFTITIDFLPIILPEELKEESFKYVLYRKTNETEDYSYVTEGNFLDKVEGTQFTINKEELTQTTYYQLFIYIDGNMSNPSDMQGQNFKGKLVVSYEMKKDFAYTSLTNLYTETLKTTVVNNGINYEYAPSVLMMKDVGGNIRYYGADPDNYIYFNCTDYSNQTADTCELWRIIGVFGDKVKLIRNNSIGSFSWDNKLSGTGSSTNNDGSNDWTDARLMMLLNPGYETTSDIYSYEGSLYWNSKSGTCYSGQNNATTSCDFTSTGLKNDTTRNMIAEVSWNLGGWNSSDVYSNQMYSYERGTTVYSGRPTSWTGKVALMYPSDYGYATDFTKCSQNLYNYNNSYACRTNDWLFNSANQWSLTPCSALSNAWLVNSSGFVIYSAITYNAFGVRPVLYLDSDIGIDSETGTGDVNNPYQIKISES